MPTGSLPGTGACTRAATPETGHGYSHHFGYRFRFAGSRCRPKMVAVPQRAALRTPYSSPPTTWERAIMNPCFTLEPGRGVPCTTRKRAVLGPPSRGAATQWRGVYALHADPILGTGTFQVYAVAYTPRPFGPSAFAWRLRRDKPPPRGANNVRAHKKSTKQELIGYMMMRARQTWGCLP